MTTAGHVTRQPIAVLESGSVNRQLNLTELGATGPQRDSVDVFFRFHKCVLTLFSTRTDLN